MALNITTAIQIEGKAGEVLDRAAARLREPRTFLRKVGVLGLSSAVRRLGASLKMDRAIRTGRLMASLGAISDTAQKANPDRADVFELSNFEVTVGSNLEYAAQRQYGGTIVPREQKALAIPLPDALKRAGRGPRDLDPNRELLTFVPYRGGKPNIIGFLVDPGDEIQVRNKRGKLKSRQVSRTGYGTGPLFVLASSVTQAPNPFLFWSAEDQAEIENKLWSQFLGL